MVLCETRPKLAEHEDLRMARAMNPSLAARMKRLRVLAVIPGAPSDNSFGFARRQVEWLRMQGVDVMPFFVTARTHPLGIFREVVRLRREIRGFRPNVVHAHYGTATGMIAAL